MMGGERGRPEDRPQAHPNAHATQPMRIAVPTSRGLLFEAHFGEDEYGMVWLNTPNRVTGQRRAMYLLSAVLEIG